MIDADKVLKRKECIEGLGVIEALSPAANAASQLRACGLRLVGDEIAIAALQQLADDGNPDAALVVGNLFPRGHAEVV